MCVANRDYYQTYTCGNVVLRELAQSYSRKYKWNYSRFLCQLCTWSGTRIQLLETTSFCIMFVDNIFHIKSSLKYLANESVIVNSLYLWFQLWHPPPQMNIITLEALVYIWELTEHLKTATCCWIQKHFRLFLHTSFWTTPLMHLAPCLKCQQICLTDGTRLFKTDR